MNNLKIVWVTKFIRLISGLTLPLHSDYPTATVLAVNYNFINYLQPYKFCLMFSNCFWKPGSLLWAPGQTHPDHFHSLCAVGLYRTPSAYGVQLPASLIYHRVDLQMLLRDIQDIVGWFSAVPKHLVTSGIPSHQFYMFWELHLWAMLCKAASIMEGTIKSQVSDLAPMEQGLRASSKIFFHVCTSLMQSANLRLFYMESAWGIAFATKS